MLTLTRILCPTDFSDISTTAEACATALARHYDAGLHLLHVDPPTPVMAPYGEIPVDIRLFEQQRELAERDLAAARERARAAGVAADASVRGGHPAREILAASAEIQADLIVLGSHGRGGVEHLLLGSVAEKVMRKAECPVMVVPAGAVGKDDVLFKRILCPIDGSASSADAVSYAVSLARETDGSLILLSVVEPVPTVGEFGAIDADEYQRIGVAHAQTLLQNALTPAVREWCKSEDVTAVGKASERILATAADKSADVIVMGVRGRGALDLMAFGSTTNEVIRRATCPVLAVHPHVEDRRRLAALPVTVTI
ncbi:MAG TPA: universal stress protein [Vicinamibacterales bacterium]|nr:universal stress protein [Vicinamibacterales bacterium]